MDLTEFAWRDGVLLVAAGVGVYLVVMLLRLVQIGRHRRQEFAVEAVADQPVPDDGPSHAAPTLGEPPLNFAMPVTTIPAAKPAEPDFAAALNVSLLENEVRQLRAEVVTLRDELAEMQAARQVSPQYAEAMALAQRGHDAQGIAKHCGISRGEAELVLALARGTDELIGGNEYAGIGPRDAAAGR